MVFRGLCKYILEISGLKNKNITQRSGFNVEKIQRNQNSVKAPKALKNNKIWLPVVIMEYFPNIKIM
jgi:hypothetical protein